MSGFKSEAVSSQGTRLGVQGAPGTPKTATITGITAADPAVITATNTFADGDIVSIDSVVGMVEINGQAGVVSAASGTGFTLTGVDSSAYTPYTSGGEATSSGATFVDVCEARNFTGFDGQASEIDVTTLCSTAMEFVPGLQDFGAFNFTMNYVPSDPAQQAMQKAKASGDTLWWKLTLPLDNNGDPMGAWLFQAFVRQMTLSGGVNAALESNVVLRITGEPTYIEDAGAFDAQSREQMRRAA